MPRQITQCPMCDSSLRVSELSCSNCDARLQGTFSSAPLATLPVEHQRFIETFVLCRGVIRDVERELGVSYPTVRARLDAAVSALETVLDPEPASLAREPVLPTPHPPRDDSRKRLLRDVEEGRLTPAQAAEALRSM
ncbi:MAG: DUF2089 domain-containing protein [Akkermansiaceae bacterium]|nr:DUF2089 domain-containing protein [Armatimonadota bacterium]